LLLLQVFLLAPNQPKNAGRPTHYKNEEPHAAGQRTLGRLTGGTNRDIGERNFAGFFKVEEVRIIIADGQDVGWIQEQVEDRTINLGSFYVMPAMQGRGIGTKVLNILLTCAADQSKAMTLAVVKINPARYFYEKRGFRITHEDQHKFYMRADPGGPRQDN
jgi:GNAT superfamily N-acetyltransferase